MSRKLLPLGGAAALSLALVAVPSAAFADHDADDRHGHPAPAASPDEHADQDADDDDPQAAPSRTTKPKPARSSETGAKRAEAGKSDPRGNNGTIKIDGAPFDDGKGNDPHVGCTFELDLYGFDAGEQRTVTFTAHAPTGAGTLLHTGTYTVGDSTQPRQDRLVEIPFSVDEHFTELASITPHPQQGWHVKVTVDDPTTSAGAKQKVFWIECPQTAAQGSAGATSSTPSQSLGATAFTGGGGSVSSSGTGRTAAGAAAAERSATDATAAGAAGAVSARSEQSPTALPFTGVAGLGTLLALGLGAVGAGIAAVRAGRRGLADL